MSSGKVKCTCGWSWNKSDSSKKDMYICHECGRDNSNNMKNGGWLDSYADGGTMQEHQENYNDPQVSLPEGFVGMGNNTKGRNYSPAWGGQFEDGGWLDNYVPEAQMGRSIGPSPIIPLTNLLVNKFNDWFGDDDKQPVKKPVAKGKPRTLNIVDPRKKMATTNQPLRPNSDLVGGKYNSNHLDKLMQEAKRQKLSKEDMMNLSAMGFQETKWGRSDDNIGHVLGNWKGNDSYQQFISAYKEKMKEADRLGIKDPATRLQVYNGMGTVTPKTEKNYHGFEMQKIYGVPIPKEGINMKKNPLYGKQVMDIRDNVLAKNPEYVQYMDSIYKAPVPEYMEDIRMNKQKPPRFIIPPIGKKEMGGYIPQAQDGTELSEYDIAMRGMMKSKIGMGNVFGNPAIKRMSQAMPKTGMTPEGIGTHYMGSMDNYAVPLLQDFGGDELRLVNPNTRSREAIRFNSPEEAQYFAEHYKDVAPMSTMYKGLQEYAMGGSIPGAVGFSYARVGAPSKGPRRNQTDVTDASAQNGKEMSYYQNGLDFKPKSISKNGGWLDSYEDGGVIKDDMGQWAHPGEITEIGSNQITMQGVPYPVLGVSNTGDTQMMYPEEEYEFDGEKVTEYPIAQNGFDAKAFQKVLDKKFPRFWRKKKDINIRETNPVKKDNTNVKQKNEIIIPTKKEKVTRSIQDQKEYMKDWMDSPMYNEMVDNSTTGISDKFFLNLDRDINHDDITISMMNQNLPNDPNVGADSNSKTGLIRVYPEGYRGPQLEGMISHEISHTIDKPVNWGGIGGDLHKFLGDPYMNGKRAIPKKDIDLMQSYYKGNDSYTELFNNDALKNKK